MRIGFNIHKIHEKLKTCIHDYMLNIFGVQNLYMFLADNYTLNILWVYDDDMNVCANNNVSRNGHSSRKRSPPQITKNYISKFLSLHVISEHIFGASGSIFFILFLMHKKPN